MTPSWSGKLNKGELSKHAGAPYTKAHNPATGELREMGTKVKTA